MKSIKSGIVAAVMSASLLTLPALAQADNFKIINSTHSELSFSINNNCENEFSSIPAHSNTIISDKDFKNACKHDLHNCIAEIYTDNYCSGEHVATVVLDTDGGLKQVLKGGPYSYTWRPFNMMITEKV